MSIRPLCPELAKKAREELNEDAKTIESDLRSIKDWLSKQPHLRARTGIVMNYFLCLLYFFNLFIHSFYMSIDFISNISNINWFGYKDINKQLRYL